MEISESTQFQVAQMEAILGPESEPFENFISHHMESSDEDNSMFNLMKNKDLDSLALKLSDFLGSSQNAEFPFSESLFETFVPDIMISFPVFLNTLNDDTLDPQVRVAVLTTAVSFILYLPS
ncbi:hypothetical protein HAX54_000440 [Datura stramonium]|uniref:Uncharacterized protein n=1 Tax=Datura stramonium TaxID=4076 RepID=A0ABS8T3A6_DATST|nr:hypothetical protein [Datura stramonium]